VNLASGRVPLLCIELEGALTGDEQQQLFLDLGELAQQFEQTQGINRFLIHPHFPVDVRHNAKIFREKLASWAQSRLDH
ncbi:MAG: peptide synthase, partial [Shewanella sp.]